MATAETSLISADACEASQPYVGEWNQLVSTTNWEKGRIILEWRGALIDSSALPAEYADETWANLVGGVTGQHVGRLRRVWQRFGNEHKKFSGLYWSHFQAALDWDDAEMWLEGALQSRWSVSQMRGKRWETLGAVAADQPRDEDVVASELDEDFEPAQRQEPIDTAVTPEYSEIVAGPRHDEGPDFGDEQDAPRAARETWEETEEDEPAAAREPVRPFASLADLPDDVADAVERFKLLILKHRREEWVSFSQSDMVAVLESLKQLALSPADEAAPF
jgi:hypothetical protein